MGEVRKADHLRQRAVRLQAASTAERRAAKPSAAAAAGAGPSSRAPKRAASQPPGSRRTGTLKATKFRRTTEQLEAAQRDQRAFEREYKDAHKAATLEYASYKKLGKQKRAGCTATDVAEGRSGGSESTHSVCER